MKIASTFLALLVVVTLTDCTYSYATPDECPFAAEIRAFTKNATTMWRENRLRLATLARASLQPSSLIFLTGDTALDRYEFRQNSNFYYLVGANMPGYYISLFLDPADPSPRTTLFVPQPSADYPVWYGHVYTKDQLRVMYDVDAVLYTNELNSYIAPFPATTTLYTIRSSVALPTALSKFVINSANLNSFVTEARATKSSKELALLTIVNKITSYAHLSAMQFITSRLNVTSISPMVPSLHDNSMTPYSNSLRRSSAPFQQLHLPFDDVATDALSALDNNVLARSTPKSSASTASNPLYEYEVESFFLFQSGLCGASQQAYLPIVGSGNNGAVLHYIANNDEIINGDLLLIDAAAEYWGYGSDVTRTYPVNGVFTDAQRLIYNIVLRTQADVVANVRAGATWSTLNTVARNSLTTYLLEAGLVQGTFAELISNTVYSVFYPHSIGHSVGLDVHDSQTSTLYANQVITVEPGVYFNNYLLDQAKAGTRSRFIVWSKVDSFRNTGGVRIEDDYIVTTNGSIQITVVPSTIDAIEKIMKKQ